MRDWATWFGVRLASLTTTIDGWRGELFDADGLQTLVHQELVMSDALGPEIASVPHTISRRGALATLAALPLARCAPVREGVASRATTELFLARCGASLTACWHLLQGNDLDTVDRMLSGYLLTLDAFARQGSRYQQSAARLASQAHRIAGIVALHRSSFEARWHQYSEAFVYAGLAADPGTEASALFSLGYTSYREGDLERAAQSYARALTHEGAISPLLRTRGYADLAKVHASMGQQQDALHAIALAEDIYPESPERDPSFVWAEFTPTSLLLEKGLAYLSLAEQFPGRRHERVAWATFDRVDGLPTPLPVPDRVRFEIISHQAETAVLMNDLDAFEIYFGRALDGAALLGSRQRRREASAAWQRASRAWPGEPRVRVLEERLRAPA